MKRPHAHLKHDSEGGGLALDLANSVGCPGCRVTDGLADEKTARAWVRAHLRVPTGPPGRTERFRVELLKFRALLTRMLTDRVSGRRLRPADLARLNAASLRAPKTLILSYRGSRLSEEESQPGADPLASSLGRIFRSAIHVLAASEGRSVRRCQGPGCVHFILARRADQLWCSPTGCGNRARVARHFRRKKAATREAAARE